MTSRVVVLAAVVALALPGSVARGDSSYLLSRVSHAQAGADYWHLRFSKMRRYARGQERMRALQLVEIKRVRSLIPDPWWVPAWFRSQALCIHRHEGSWDNENTGHNGHYGGLQFAPSTWASVGGRGDPADASPAEQIYRAWLVWKRDGGSWREWPTRIYCGLA